MTTTNTTTTTALTITSVLSIAMKTLTIGFRKMELREATSTLTPRQMLRKDATRSQLHSVAIVIAKNGIVVEDAMASNMVKECLSTYSDEAGKIVLQSALAAAPVFTTVKEAEDWNVALLICAMAKESFLTRVWENTKEVVRLSWIFMKDSARWAWTTLKNGVMYVWNRVCDLWAWIKGLFTKAPATPAAPAAPATPAAPAAPAAPATDTPKTTTTEPAVVEPVVTEEPAVVEPVVTEEPAVVEPVVTEEPVVEATA